MLGSSFASTRSLRCVSRALGCARGGGGPKTNGGRLEHLPRLRTRHNLVGCYSTTPPLYFARPANKKKSVGGSSAGRIVQLSRKGKEGNKPKLCVGCGVEVVRGDSSGEMAGNEKANEMTRASKKNKGLYADILEGTGFLCERCKALKKGGFYEARDVLADVPPSVFREQLTKIVNRRRFGFAIKVIDATDITGSMIASIRNSIKSLPIILVVNKIDLLPTRVNHFQLNAWKRTAMKCGLSVISVIPVSAENGDGVLDLAKAVLEKLQGRDVFVVGAANVGKSTLVKKISKILGEVAYMKRKSRRDTVKNLQTTISHLPGTTLQAVRIPCFSSPKHALWDTPGIINDSALTYHLFPSRIMEPLALSSRIVSGRSNVLLPGSSVLLMAPWLKSSYDDVERSEGPVLARIDNTGNTGIRFAPFTREPIHVQMVRTNRAPEQASVSLENEESIVVPLVKFSSIRPDPERSGIDVEFSSLGWVSFYDRDGAISLQPWIVQKSRWSKRDSNMYPTNLLQQLEESPNGRFQPYVPPERDVLEVLDKETFRNLRNIQREGRHNEPRQNNAWDRAADDDEWY